MVQCRGAGFGRAQTHAVVPSLTRLLFLLAAALSSGVQHHLLDDFELLIQPRKVEICAFLGHCGKI